MANEDIKPNSNASEQRGSRTVSIKPSEACLLGIYVRRSLAGVLVMMTAASCLVTSTPDLTPTPQQPPYLIAARASPDLLAPVVISDPNSAIPFSASVFSSDPNEVLWVELVIDYGKLTADGFKAYDRIGPAQIPPTGQTGRPVTKTWIPSARSIPGGCHTVTMFVSHQFDGDTVCPMRLCDSSQITWVVNIETGSCVPNGQTALPSECNCAKSQDECSAFATPADQDALRTKYACPGDDAAVP